MITALSTPGSGRILPDANNTVIKIQSTNGEGYYFRAKIYIDNVFFDEQGWSRIDLYTATKDLKKLYNAYYQTIFTDTFQNQLTEQTHLIKQVKIVVEEYSIETDVLVDSLELPVFKFLYTIKPVEFDDSVKLKILGIDAENVPISTGGKISIPFYVNADNEQVHVRVETNFNTALDIRWVPAIITGKKVYLYQFDLASLTLSYDILYLTAKITCSSPGNEATTITQLYTINRLPDYPFKEIAFRNNYGFYMYAYLDGEMTIENAFDPEVYETADSSKKVYEIAEEATYIINTGSLLHKEKAIINMIANSLDTRFWNGEKWLPIVTKIKKQTEFKDKVNSYSESLQFTLQKGTDIANSGFITVASPLTDIEITSFSVSGNNATINFVFNNGFYTPAFEIQARTSPSSAWTSLFFVGSSPVTISLPDGVYTVRMRPHDDPTNVSNSITITIS
ncbi:hypothetical protein [Flavobacterium beibuense]|uniref:hypothetical protein n=1 Tax=Flavobacterium beibuense TaxID=657326 RepID=UPI003A951062